MNQRYYSSARYRMASLRVLLFTCVLCINLQGSLTPRATSGIVQNLSRARAQATGYLKRLWHGAETKSGTQIVQAAERQVVPKAAQAPSWTAEALSLPKTSSKTLLGGTYAQRFMQAPLGQELSPRSLKIWQLLIAWIGGSATGITIGTGIAYGALYIADIAPGLFNMAMFDDDLVSEKFGDAIVRIHNWKSTGGGTAFIVRSDVPPYRYYVLTAAHCVRQPAPQYYIAMKDPRYENSKKLMIDVKPVILDYDQDVAVLLIEEFHPNLWEYLPYIPANHLSEVKPHKKEAAASIGFPALIVTKEEHHPHTTKFAYKGPQIFRYGKKQYQGEAFTSWYDKRSHVGASGSPVIVIRDNQPHIVGIYTSESIENPRSRVIRGVSELPRYLKDAEAKVQQEQADRLAQQKASQQGSGLLSRAYSWLRQYV